MGCCKCKKKPSVEEIKEIDMDAQDKKIVEKAENVEETPENNKLAPTRTDNHNMAGIQKLKKGKHQSKKAKKFEAKDILYKTSVVEPLGHKAAVPPGYRATPDTTKTSAIGENTHLFAGFSMMCGWKETMEDVPIGLLSLAEDRKASYFAVFDGHRGSKVSVGLGKAMHKYICQNQYYKAGKYEDAITEGFLSCDSDLRNIDALKDHMCGSTACICILRNNCEDIYVGNCGDSRIIACVDGKAYGLSDDHKPYKPIEKARIEKAGGFVQNGRVNGRLAVARSLGDFDYKQDVSLDQKAQLISPNPDIVTRKVTEKWDFIMLGSDGIFDVVTNQEVVDFIIGCIAQDERPDKVCEKLMVHCMAEYLGQYGGSHDNMSVVLACFLHGKPYETLVHKCKQLVEAQNDEN